MSSTRRKGHTPPASGQAIESRSLPAPRAFSREGSKADEPWGGHSLDAGSRGFSPTRDTIAGATDADSSAVLQSKTLEDAGLKGDLTDSSATRKVVDAVDLGGGLDAKVYTNPDIEKQGDRVSAIQAAAGAAAAVGERVDTWGRKDKVGGSSNWKPSKMFTKTAEALNDSDVATLDPFCHQITVPYSLSEADKELQFIYQHNAGFAGYIAMVKDTGSEAKITSEGANMYFGRSNKSTTENPYSDKHSKSEETNILGMTTGSDHEAVDAYTKLAGEGARFKCVRANVSKLANDSRFYCQDPDKEDSILTVRFDKLWVSWSKTFDKQYNIENSEVIKKLKGSLGKSEKKTTLDSSRDVDLGG